MGRLAIVFEGFFNRVNVYYERVLHWTLSRRKTVYAIITVLLFGSFGLVVFGFIGTQFIPEGDRGEFMIKLETDPQNTLYQTNLATQEVEDILFSKPEVIKVFSNVGNSSSDWVPVARKKIEAK